ncbi:MAG: hypothetical protein JXP73_16075 [Deltaproteobacteria bacterium]|nr:hypothetical protein [Deltaproteobacteria bacterium]
MKRDEAELILFWRQFFAGAMPPLLRRLAAIGPEATPALARGLARASVRYLLAQGGAHPDVSLGNGQRTNQRALWSAPFIALDFRKPLLAWLAQTATGRKPRGRAEHDLGAGGEIILLMIADELAQRPRADLPLDIATTEGALAWLVHGGQEPPAFQGGPTLDDALFFARGRLARAWLALDPLGPASATILGIENVLELAEQRKLAWQRLRGRVVTNRRYDLVAPICAAAAALWQDMDAERLVARIEEIGRFAGESPRQAAYQRLSAAYAWLADLESWAEEARRTGQFHDDFARWQVFLAYYRRVPEHARAQSSRLLALLRRTL